MNNQVCKVTKDNSGYTVELRPKLVSEALKDKLSQENIEESEVIIERQLKLSGITTNLHRQCDNTNCKAKDICVFRAVPNGSTNAKVMFINKVPTEYEMCNMSSLCDKNGMYLSLILSKMNVSRDAVYCTDMIKCNAQLDEQSYNECINTYIKKEIELVMPQVIVCNGLSVLKACIKANLILGLSLDVTYGKIYDAKTKNDRPVKIIAMYDLDTVLQKTEDDYKKCKAELWAQLLSAFRACVD